MLQNIINHIVFVVDRSGSMSGLSSTTIKVFDNQIKWLAQRSKELDQETRVSVYLFGSQIECVIYDMDVLRLPSLAELYKIEGMTKLVDATLLAVEDLRLQPEKYGDHAFLIYVLTDGQENESRRSGSELKTRIETLPENWTFATYVPNQNGVFEAKKHGFPADNIAVWSTTEQGIEQVGRAMQDTTETYFQARSRGIRGSRSLFKLDLSKLTTSVVARNLQHLAPWEYKMFLVKNDSVIKPFVEYKAGIVYKITNHHGPAFYELEKSEIVQPQKRILIMDRENDKLYGGETARQLLHLPNTQVRLKPEDTGKYDVFVESTSYTRKLPSGTRVIVLSPNATINNV